jgi:hypothetical protein
MAVSPLELRPRGAVALLDAGLRVCVCSSGVWALTLPGGALVTAALLHLADTLHHRRELTWPALWLTLAWLARGLFQGAACHHVQELLLGQGPGAPSTWASLRAALARAPALLTAVAWLFTFNLLSLTLTLGLAFFFLSSHLVGYAAIMQGRGSPLGLYKLCARMLGPARGGASRVRVSLLVQWLAFLNLHIAANAVLIIGRKLLGIDLTFAERFASLDNTPWLIFLAALTFTLFEPLRAATATLLLVDGRVRMEGLDLMASLRQLPVRARALGMLALLVTLLPASPAHAQRLEPPASRPELRARLERLAMACALDDSMTERWRRTLDSLSQAEALKFQRLLRGVEERIHHDEDCGAMERLEQGVDLAEATIELERAGLDARTARERARDILSRSEFVVIAEPEKQAAREEEVVMEAPGWWQRFLKWLGELLEKWFRKSDPTPATRRPFGGLGGEGLANLLVVLIAGTVLGVLAVVLLRALRQDRQADGSEGLEVSTLHAAALATHSANALSRPPESWAGLADELAARGEYREAVRNLYLALLSRLHHEGVIHYDTTLSNWDYLRQFKHRREWLPSFRELTRRFDFAWYGNLPVGAEGYRDFRALCTPMLSTSGEAAGA